MRCKGINSSNGKRCSKNATEGSNVCPFHSGQTTVQESYVIDDENEVPEMEHEESSITNHSVNTVNVKEVEDIVMRITLNAHTEMLSQIQHLQNQVAAMKLQLENHKGTTRVEPNPAKRDFYFKNKSNPEILEEIKKRLVNVGMHVPDKPVPWQLVRAATDALFDALPEDQKKLYNSV